MSSDNTKPRATVSPLDWQGELDAAMADLDVRLTNPRRHVRGSNRPVTRGADNVQIPPALVEEIARRVADQIRQPGGPPAVSSRPAAPAKPSQPSPASPPARRQAPLARPETPAPRANTPAPTADAPPPPQRTETVKAPLGPGKTLRVRYQLPALQWPLSLLLRRRRKKQHPLTTARLRA
jgi:hypothetical protein